MVAGLHAKQQVAEFVDWQLFQVQLCLSLCVSKAGAYLKRCLEAGYLRLGRPEHSNFPRKFLLQNGHLPHSFVLPRRKNKKW